MKQSNPPHQPIYLWPERERVTPDREILKDQRICQVDNPCLLPFFPKPDTANGTSVIIFPGGGYTRIALQHEGIEIAHWFTARGITAFVVKYRLHDYGFPAPMLDGLRALKIVRKNAEEWNLDPHKIGLVGFSAGGHLAASIALNAKHFEVDDDPLRAIDSTVNFLILGYPVIFMEGDDAHKGSRKALLGDNPSPSLLHNNSLQHHVNNTVPPTFLFHGIGDSAVPVTNSLALFTEIQKQNKQSELHIYQTHIHGVGMIQGQGSVSSWPQALVLWLRQNHWVEGK